MPFSNSSKRLQTVADNALKMCKQRHGKTGLKIEMEIDPSIQWRPTFHLRPSTAMILAVHVSNRIYPEILKIAAHDISKFDHPVSVIAACPLDVYLADKKQKVVNELKSHGFGLITVDVNTGSTTLQHTCIPIAQHISEADLVAEMDGLSPTLKVRFRTAHTSYLGNEGQGLQAAGQIVEAIIVAIQAAAEKAGVVGGVKAGTSTADIIDGLYAEKTFKDSRAALGGARSFVKSYRNVASHPAKSASNAIAKIRKCRLGFLEGIKVARDLMYIASQRGYQIRIHVT